MYSGMEVDKYIFVSLLFFPIRPQHICGEFYLVFVLSSCLDNCEDKDSHTVD